MVKVAPWSGPGLATSMVPPCPSTSALAMASPMPDPPLVRSRAQYHRSLHVLKRAREMAEAAGQKCATKSGLMLGLGETEGEVHEAMDALRAANVTVLTLGQYLRPSPQHLPVVSYIEPAAFDAYKAVALEKGFRHVASAPLVRSSYHASDFWPELD